jgi:hypothetical protein
MGRRDNPRGDLRAGDLDSHQQGTEGEDHEGKRRRYESLEQDLRVCGRKAQETPSEENIKPVQQSCGDPRKRNGNKWNRPKRRSEIVPEAV